MAESLRLFRTRMRWTQERMAKEIGVSRGRYSNWESGSAHPKREHLSVLRSMGVLSATGQIAEERAPYGREDPQHLALLIDILYQSDLPEDIRARTKDELLKILGVPSSGKLH